MKSFSDTELKVKALARWENEGGRCPECEVSARPPERQPADIAGLPSLDKSLSPEPQGVRPPDKPTGKPRL